MMENTGYDTLIGNPNAPFINSAIARLSRQALNHYSMLARFRTVGTWAAWGTLATGGT